MESNPQIGPQFKINTRTDNKVHPIHVLKIEETISPAYHTSELVNGKNDLKVFQSLFIISQNFALKTK
ncbi:hypothetical protein [Leptospira alexanderi]|uniref:hypothetical protein n=1 Tax=Leptospira alexanderi TaxID=100053 RepID=UPI001AD832BE|nr:hypothetical protein [Leptospira alexanderi]